MRNNRILLFIAVIMLLKSNSYGQFSLRTKLDSLFNSDASWVDYNNNNIPDILLTGADKDLVEKTILFDGDLSGNFNPVSSNLPAADGAICVWGDFDNDGDLDLFITGDMAGGATFSKLYENQSGTFVENTSSAFTALSGYIDAAMFVDYDNDGDLDLSYSGWDGASIRTVKIYQNINGIYSDISANINFGSRGSIDWGDYDNDGDMDLLASGSNGSDIPLKIIRNDGEGNFTDAGKIADVIFGTAKWVDYDNDGDLDIFYSSLTSNSYPNGSAHNGFYRNNLSSNTSTAFELDPSTTSDVIPLALSSFDFIDYDKDRDLD